VAEQDQHIVLLNWLQSRSATHSRTEAAPTIPASQLIDMLRGRLARKFAIEFPGVKDKRLEDENNELQRIRSGIGQSCIRLYDIKTEELGEFKYVTLLIKYIDANTKAFPVEDMMEFTGREIAGNETERGVVAIHLATRLPVAESQFDLGKYRCVIDLARGLTRKQVEHFLCRQIRRQTDAEDWSFSVASQTRRGKPITKNYKYTPRLELLSDVGRNLTVAMPGGGDLSSMVFTKREEKQAIGPGTHIKHKDVTANVEIRISGNQAPVDDEEKATWIEAVRSYFTGQGYQSRIYYRHVNGGILGGEIHPDIAGAADLLMCPKEYLTLAEPIRPWEPKVNSGLAAEMKILLNRDELWERST